MIPNLFMAFGATPGLPTPGTSTTLSETGLAPASLLPGEGHLFSSPSDTPGVGATPEATTPFGPTPSSPFGTLGLGLDAALTSLAAQFLQVLDPLGQTQGPFAELPRVSLLDPQFSDAVTPGSAVTPGIAGVPGVSIGEPGLNAPGEARESSGYQADSQLDPQVAGLARSGGTPIHAPSVRSEFPILEERVHGRRLVWLDNAATTQKPRAVIERLSYFYEHENSNIHRAAHTLAARATDAYEGAREIVRRFIGARSTKEIVFVRGATEAINLVAQTFGRAFIAEGDEIVISWLEHHANIVPWQMLVQQTGARLRIIPVDDRGQVILSEYAKLLGPRTKLVSITQVSNALGTVVPVHEMIGLAHSHGARVLVDGAQSVSHMPTNVQLLDADFFVFSGHKVFAPTGIGVLYGKEELLEQLPPWQGGGNMIEDVTFEGTRYQNVPARFEAGTGNIADAVGLGAALEWLERLGVPQVELYEHTLLEYATAQLARVPGLRIIGTAPEKAGVISFVLAGRRTQDIGAALDREGIAVRSGHHCAQPILRRFGLEATVRASFAPYNVTEDVDALVSALCSLVGAHKVYA